MQPPADAWGAPQPPPQPQSWDQSGGYASGGYASGGYPYSQPQPSGGQNTGLIIGLVLLAVLVIGGGAFLLLSGDDDDDDNSDETAQQSQTDEDPATDDQAPQDETQDPPDPGTEGTAQDPGTEGGPEVPDLDTPETDDPGTGDDEGTGLDELPTDFDPTTETPSGIPELDPLAEDCGNDVWQACDDIFDEITENQAQFDITDPDVQAYLIYGDTCAGNQPAGTRNYCRNSMG